MRVGKPVAFRGDLHILIPPPSPLGSDLFLCSARHFLAVGLPVPWDPWLRHYGLLSVIVHFLRAGQWISGDQVLRSRSQDVTLG